MLYEAVMPTDNTHTYSILIDTSKISHINRGKDNTCYVYLIGGSMIELPSEQVEEIFQASYKSAPITAAKLDEVISKNISPLVDAIVHLSEQLEIANQRAAESSKL
jgi:hypothetical protein